MQYPVLIVLLNRLMTIDDAFVAQKKRLYQAFLAFQCQS
jgi:hypothetical protein